MDFLFFAIPLLLVAGAYLKPAEEQARELTQRYGSTRATGGPVPQAVERCGNLLSLWTPMGRLSDGTPRGQANGLFRGWAWAALA